jgi:hypothetical protein
LKVIDWKAIHSLQETALVINQGVTIAGKTMKEHLEVINHIEALPMLEEPKKKYHSQSYLLFIIFLARGIQLDDAGKYRKTELNE